MSETNIIGILSGVGVFGAGIAITIVKKLWDAYREKGKTIVLLVESATKSNDALKSAIDLQRLREEEMYRLGENMHREAMDRIARLEEEVRKARS